MPTVIKARRADLGMSQAQLAAAAGVDTRQVRRYESGEQQPSLSVAVSIAQALGITIGELAGEPTQRMRLTGDWWASWQTFRDGQELQTAQEVSCQQNGETVTIRATTRGLAVEDGGYLWRGELRLWDNEILIGWYVADEQAIRSKGSLYFVIHPHGQSMTGRWVGLSYDGQVITGWAAMAKTEEAVRSVITDLTKTTGRPR